MRILVCVLCVSKARPVMLLYPVDISVFALVAQLLILHDLGRARPLVPSAGHRLFA